MNFSQRIARRYFFSNSTASAINIISGISVLGVALGTAAMIIILSVFNGFGGLITEMFGFFNPDIKVEIIRGKYFEENQEKTLALVQMEGVDFVSKTIEEIAFFEYDQNQRAGTLKGVDELYPFINDIDSTIVEGRYHLTPDETSYAVLGAGMRRELAVNVDNDLEPLMVYMAKRGRVSSFEDPFKRASLKPMAIFSIQQDFDDQYVLSDLAFAQRLLGLEGQLGAYEIKLKNGADADATKVAIKELFGEEFRVMTKYEQDAGFLRIMNIEKWVSYAILILTFLLVAFNIVGALWMIVLEKKNDMATFKAMGANDRQVSNIFLYEGLMLCAVGLVIGIVISLAVYFLQDRYGIIATPNGFSYPISLKLVDFILIIITVVAISLLASIPAAVKARTMMGIVRSV